MRRLFLPLLALSPFALADEIPAPDVKVSEVTVYSDRAEVVRQTKLKLTKGEHTVIFDNLPGATDLSSTRMRGEGAFTLIDIRAETVQSLEVEDARIRQFQTELNKLQRQRDEIAKANARLESQKSALDKVLGRLTGVGKESINPEMDPAKWAAYLNFHANEITRIGQTVLQNQNQLADLAKETDRVTREMNELNQHRYKFHKVARVKIEAKEDTEATLALSYIVTGTGWAPSYDIRVDSKEKKLQVFYNAEVRQSTGEDWKGVALKLSTAQPGLIGREPLLSPWFINKLVPVPVAAAAPSAPAPLEAGVAVTGGNLFFAKTKQLNKAEQQNFNAFGADAREDRDRKAGANHYNMEFERVQVAQGGTSATFTIARAYDILSNNKSVKVAIAQEAFPATFRYTCVPKLDNHVYLKANVVNKSDYPFLPGPTSVYLDGAFVSKADMELVPAGQEFWTYLGVDQNITVEHKEIAKREENGGLFNSKIARTVHEYLFKVKNSKNTEVDLVIWDQIPMSNHEEIKVILEEPKYSKDSDTFKMTEQKFVEWRLSLQPSEKREVPFRFTIERPEGFPIVGQ